MMRTCQMPECNNPAEQVHHVRKLFRGKDSQGRVTIYNRNKTLSDSNALMSAKSRKQIAVCLFCHYKIHHKH